MAMDKQKNQFQLNRSRKNLRREVGRAIADFNMIENGDLVMVCLSGGKDSYAMLDILLSLQRHAPIDFAIKAVNLDQKQPGFPEHVLPGYLASIGVDFKILEQDTYSVVKEKTEAGKTFCGLCSRLRRGSLYTYAREIGANKIAYCKEKEIARYAELMGFPIIPCNLCGSQPNMQRQVIKQMLAEWDRNHPGRIETIFRSITNVTLSHLADPSHFPFSELRANRFGQDRLDIIEIL